MVSDGWLLWPSHDMDMRIGRAGPHDVSTGWLVLRRQPSQTGIEGPHDHPVRPNLDGRTGLVIGGGIASLLGAREHISDPRYRVERFWQMTAKRVVPLHRCLVFAHRRVGDAVRVARHAGPLVRSLTNHRHVPLG